MHARRARCFGSVAASYARHRPDYPEQAVAWALGSLPDNARVLDLAAGTGKLTEAMLRPDRALGEIARVLRPGGVLAALGNTEDDSVDWVAELTAAAQAQRSAGMVGRGFADLPEHPAFIGPQLRGFRWLWPCTIDSLLDTVSTHSWAVTTSPDQRAAIFAAIRRFLETHPSTFPAPRTRHTGHGDATRQGPEPRPGGGPGWGIR